MNWEIKKLGEVCEFYNGKAHEKSIDENGKYKVVNSKFVSSNGTKAKRTQTAQFPLFKDDIVMVMSDVPNGKTLAKCFLIDKNDTYSLNQRVCAFRTTNFDKRFLFYQLNRNPYFLAFNNGENQSNLRKGDILDCPLFVPSIKEQKQIVKILDQAFTAIELAKNNAQQNLLNAKQLFESYLQNVFENKGDDWVEKRLKEVTIKIGSGATPRGGKSSYKLEGISLIRSMNVHDFEFREKNLAFIDNEQADKLSNVIIQENDILLNITGASIARCCIVPNKYLPARVNQHVSIIRANQSIINPLFLGSLLTSKFYKDQILEIGEQGATRQAITKVQLENFKIIFPKEISKQKEVIKKMKTLSAETKKLETIYEQKIIDLEELKKSVLQKAFSGALTQKELV